MKTNKGCPDSDCDGSDESDRWKAFARLLQETRLQRGLTLKQVSDSLGLADGHLAAIESGKTSNPGIQTAFKLADYYCLRLDTLTQREPRSRTDEAVLVAEIMDNELDQSARKLVVEIVQSIAKCGLNQDSGRTGKYIAALP